ncbi:c2h2 type zinc finger domain-containing protein [Fusarium sporotrichioides]|uniref:C2h2 type zinc finger domain-containing protein n=1 Tax=Fusarium sporotrichioides TaxID=5514 RepID=A0A395RJA7_FUSSP|nr:c2h2 type zinc finger domain-containing protein [Fusarium sporotrichioides]
MFRSFSRLHSRVLLHKQDELKELEQRLDQLDQEDSKVDSYRLLTNRHISGDAERRTLLREIEVNLNGYNKLLESLMAHQERPEPDESQIQSVRNWVDGKRPVVYSETTFLNDSSDLKRARHAIERGGLENLLARYIRKIERSESKAPEAFKAGSCLASPDYLTCRRHIGSANWSSVLGAAYFDAALYYCCIYEYLLVSPMLAYIVQELRDILRYGGLLCRDGCVCRESTRVLGSLPKNAELEILANGSDNLTSFASSITQESPVLAAEPPVAGPKKGTRLSRETQRVLRDWFNAHSDNPYPDDATKEAFQHLTGLSKKQLTNWFANARRRYETPKPLTSASQAIDISKRPGTPRPEQEAFNPMQRWIDSPPKDEPAPISAIVRAVSNSSLNPLTLDNAYIPTLYPSSISSAETSRGSSSSSAWSGSSTTHQGSSRDRMKRRRRGRRKAPPSKPTPFECTFCTEKFSKKYDWQRHEKSIHLGLERWLCHAESPDSLHPESGKRCCVFCSQEDPDQEHIQAHNPSACQERMFNRKDHLRQHLRLVHRADFVPWSMDSWKDTISDVRSRCGLCGIMFNTWQARSDHLAEHFKMGHTMAAWKGDWGFDEDIVNMVENAIPPYLICTERNSPFPFQGSSPAATSPRSAHEMIILELMHFVETYREENESMPGHQILQLEACRIIFASETLSTLDSTHHQPPSWLRDVIMSNHDIAQRALFGPIRSGHQNRLPSLEIKGQRSLFDNCPLELELRRFVDSQRISGHIDIWDAELQQEACKIIKAVKGSAHQESYNTVSTWLIDIIFGSADWLFNFRQRTAFCPDVPQHPVDPKRNEEVNLFTEDAQLVDLGTIFLQQDVDASEAAISEFPQHNIVTNGNALNDFIDIGNGLGANQLFWADMSPYMLNDANFHEKLGKELGRWVASTMSPRNPTSHVPTDDELRHQARWIAYGDDDPWNQTHADNPEWLQRFKDSVGLS